MRDSKGRFVKGSGVGIVRTNEIKRKISEGLRLAHKKDPRLRLNSGFKKGHPDYLSKEQHDLIGKKSGDTKRGKKLTQKQRDALQSYWSAKKGQVSKKRNGYEITCPVCGTKRYKNQRDLKRARTSFCSISCAYKFRDQGKTDEKMRIRKSKEYKLWRESVFKRDNWICQECQIRGGVLHPHHIKPFALFPELRFAIDNGVTLCASCHHKTDTWGNRIHNYKKLLVKT